MTPAAILLVTWIISGQTPASYQASFPTIAACEDAKAKVYAEQQRLTNEEAANVAELKTKGVMQVPRTMSVTAICAEQ